MKLRIGLILLLLVGIAGCCKSTTGINGNVTPPGVTLAEFQNSSFSVDGQPSLNGWTRMFGNKTDTADLFVRETPSGADGWCAVLHSSMLVIVGLEHTLIPAVSGSYRLTGFARSVGINGRLGFAIRGSSGLQIHKTISVLDSVWMLYALVDTLALAPNDTLSVVLQAASSELIPGETFFDDISAGPWH